MQCAALAAPSHTTLLPHTHTHTYTHKQELFEETSVRSVELLGEVPGWLHYDFPEWIRARATGRWAAYRGQAQKWYLFSFFGQDAEINLNTAHKEFSAWRWTELEELPAKVIPFKRPVYERVAADFGRRIQQLREEGQL